MRILDVYRKLDELFGLGKMYDGFYMDAYLQSGHYAEAAEAFSRYVQVITSDAALPRKDLFAPGLQVEEGRPAMTKELRRMILRSLEETQFQPLWEYPQAVKAREKLRESLQD